MQQFDVIVVGFGAMGSASVYQLAKRGVKVLAIDRFSPPHTNGSTHGETRITRLAIGEGEEYVDFAVRSHEIWRGIEDETGEQLLFSIGGLIISSPDSKASCHGPNFFDNTLAAAQSKGIPHEILSADDIRGRFPQFRVKDDEAGYFEPTAGYLSPKECVKAQLDLAGKYGAVLHTGETVTDFTSSGSAVTVKTDSGTYVAKQLVITAGAWLPGLLEPAYGAKLNVYRQVLYWFDIKPEASEMFAPGRCPVFIWDLQDKDYGIYGFPAVSGPNGGVKIATESFYETTTPETIDRRVTGDEIAHMYENFVEPYFSGLTGECPREPVTCMYTVRDESRFLIDWHPAQENVLIVSPCSGHGFKHSAAIGEAVAQMVVDGKSELDVSAFSFRSR